MGSFVVSKERSPSTGSRFASKRRNRTVKLNPCDFWSRMTARTSPLRNQRAFEEYGTESVALENNTFGAVTTCPWASVTSPMTCLGGDRSVPEFQVTNNRSPIEEAAT